MDLAARIEAQRARIAALEAALWRDGLDADILAPYQAAFRELEGLLAAQGAARHHFVVVIPVADSPRQLRNCLDSLYAQCEDYAYGGLAQGRCRKVSVLLADDSADPANIAEHRAIAAGLERRGIRVEYFGQEEQLALLDRLPGIALGGVIGDHPRAAFGHKGQAMMRNIAYLRLAELQAQHPGERLLFYTVDADQEFRVKVATPHGGRSVNALNYLYHLDRLFSETEVQVLTGKVVGDPPVSPAVMAGNFLDDVIAFLCELSALDPAAVYRQPHLDTRGSGEASYHDMAELFGFTRKEPAYRYRCGVPGSPDNAQCLADFAAHLKGFLHGQHPTRITWYRYLPVAESVQAARTVYTGNYLFTPQALGWFIPFAPLRLRMSGPTMGRMLKAGLGDAFASANVPMLHGRTLEASGASEFRPGVVAADSRVDLSDEFERQFFGDVMLFSMQRLTASGYPDTALSRAQIGATLDAVYAEMRGRYHDRQRHTVDQLTQLQALLQDPAQWWHRLPAAAGALHDFEHFVANIKHNFGPGSAAFARIDSAQTWRHWRGRQLDAIDGLHRDRLAWQAALAILTAPAER